MCAICGHRPKAENRQYCINCQAKIDKGKNLRKGQEPVKFATYQEHVVGFYRQVDGKLIPRLLRRNSDGLPKSKTLDLNQYIEGFTREQVKNLKAAILQLAHS